MLKNIVFNANLKNTNWPMSFFGRVTQQFPQEKGFETSDFKAGGCCCSL